VRRRLPTIANIAITAWRVRQPWLMDVELATARLTEVSTKCTHKYPTRQNPKQLQKKTATLKMMRVGRDGRRLWRLRLRFR
jgi:hypothetical protein